jgi:hypothetical protein
MDMIHSNLPSIQLGIGVFSHYAINERGLQERILLPSSRQLFLDRSIRHQNTSWLMKELWHRGHAHWKRFCFKNDPCSSCQQHARKSVYKFRRSSMQLE